MTEKEFRKAAGGRWHSACLPDATSSQKMVIEFADRDGFVLGSSIFADTNCSEEIAEFAMVGSYSPERPAGKNRQEIVVGFTSQVISPRSEFAAQALNGSKFCGITDWVANSPHSVPEDGCGLSTMKLNTQYKDTIFVKGGELKSEGSEDKSRRVSYFK
jgi:hypothetical protein